MALNAQGTKQQWNVPQSSVNPMQTSQDIWGHFHHHRTLVFFHLDIVLSALKHHQAQMLLRFSFSLDFIYQMINLSLVQSAVAYSQTCLFWVTLKSHITSSTYHRIKLYKQPFLVFENHFTIAEANKFQKDPRTEILGYKTFKGHCTLRECFLSWGNIFLFGLLSFSPLALCFSLLLFFHSSEGN